jgi:hypothetical protein
MLFSTTTVAGPNGPSTTYSRYFQFPATIDYDEFTESNGDLAATTKVSQNYQDQRLTTFGFWPVAFSQVTNAGQYQDTLNYVCELQPVGKPALQRRGFERIFLSLRCAGQQQPADEIQPDLRKVEAETG